MITRNQFSIVLFLGVSLFLRTTQAGMVEIAAEAGQRLVVKGWDLHVVVTQVPNARTLRIQGVDDQVQSGLYIVEKKGTVLEVRMIDWPTKTDWKMMTSAKRSKRLIEISGPSMPMEVYARDLNLTTHRWQKEMRVSAVIGKVSSVDGSGSFQVHLHQGDVSVQQHEGRVVVNQYSGHINIKNVQGDTEVGAFSSQVQIEKTKGALSLNTQNSAVKAVQCSGNAQIDNGKGSLQFLQFQGRIEGQTQEGPITATLQADSDVHLRSVSGRLQIQLPVGSGAFLNLVSNEGDIYLPESQKVVRTATEKSFRGRLSGETQKAAVTIRSQEGSIIIK